MTPDFFEKVLIKLLYTQKGLREKIFPFLSEKIFDGPGNRFVMIETLKFQEDFNRFPKPAEIKSKLCNNQEVYDNFVKTMNLDTSDFEDDFIVKEIETFVKEKLIIDAISSAHMSVREHDLKSVAPIPDEIREALAFSFDSNIGMDFLNSKDRFYDAIHNKDMIIPSGIVPFDKMIGGGFHEKSLTLFMAEANLGKSLIMTSLATSCLLQNKNVLYISLEMSEEKVSERIAANLFDIEMDELKNISKDKMDDIFEGTARTVKNKLFIKEFPPKTINANHIRSLLKELAVKQKFVPDVVFVDYLGIMNSIRANKNDNSYSELKRISEELRAVSVENISPIISGVQTNRKGFGEAELELTDISDSIGITATADLIIGVCQTDEFRQMGKFLWLTLKNRYGINKKSLTVNVNYYKMRVYEDAENSEHMSKIDTPVLSNEEKNKKIDDAVADLSGFMKNRKKTNLEDLEI